MRNAWHQSSRISSDLFEPWLNLPIQINRFLEAVMEWLFAKVAFLKDLVSVLARPILLAAGVNATPKSGAYFPLLKDGHAGLDTMTVGWSFRSPVRLHVDNDDYELVVVDYTPDFREVDFVVRCFPLRHKVGTASWKPWPENPNCLQVDLVFTECGRNYTQVFRKIRR